MALISPINGSAASTTSPAASLALPSWTIAEGNTIEVAISIDDPTKSISTVTDTRGNVYRLKKAQNGTGVRTELWVAYGIAAQASNIITITPTASVNIAGAAEEYSNVQNKIRRYLVQSAIGSNGVRAFTNDVTSGNLLIVATEWYHGCSTPPSISDTLGTSWSSVSVTSFDTNNLTVFYGFAPSSGPNTVTITCSSATFWITGVQEFQNIDSFDTSVTATFNSTSSPQNSGNLTTAFNDELLIGSINGYRSAGTFSVSAPETFLSSFANGNDCLATHFKQVGTAGTYSMDFAQGGGNDHGGIVLLAFKVTSTFTEGENTDGQAVASDRFPDSLFATQEGNNWGVAAIGFTCASGDTLTALVGTSRRSSIPAATAVGIALYDNSSVLALSGMQLDARISTARNWATAGSEMRAVGQVANEALSPDDLPLAPMLQNSFQLNILTPKGFDDAAIGTNVLPPEGNGQIFPPAIFR